MGTLRVRQCSAASSGGIYASAERSCAGQAAVLRLVPKEKKRKKKKHLCARIKPKPEPPPSAALGVVGRCLVSVDGSALQDRVLPAGGEQDRLGGSGEVPGPEADRNWSLWDRLVRPEPTFSFPPAGPII